MRLSRSCNRLGWALLALWPAALLSQPIYRCGNSYSQLPCPQAIVISVDDGRTPAQKAQTDAATTQAARSADRMEHDRLALERRPTTTTAMGQRQAPKPAQANTPEAKPVTDKGKPKARVKPKTTSTSAATDYFTASTRKAEAGKKTQQPGD